MNKLSQLLKMTQKELKYYLYNYLKQKNINPIFGNGFVYAEGDIPILLVAHLDTVFEHPPQKIIYDELEDKIFNPDGGLGGDDRCGVYAIMELLEEYRPYVLFTEDEEIGCIGAKKAVEKLPIPKVKYIIEFDRRGCNDCVFYDCGNEEFMKYIESFGFMTNYGTCSDISVLGSAWDIASVNLSSGYYFEHTKKEYIVFHELINNINRVKKMLNSYKDVPYFDYQEIKSIPSYYAPLFFSKFIDESLLFWDEQFFKGVETSSFDYHAPKYSKSQEETRKISLKKEKNKKNKKGDKK